MMINASVRLLSLNHGTIRRAGTDILSKTRINKNDKSLIKIFRRSGATIASNTVRISVDEGVPRIGKRNIQILTITKYFMK